MFDDLIRGVEVMAGCLVVSVLVLLPLAAWKAWELGSWLFNNVTITW